MTIEAVNRRGRPVELGVIFTPLGTDRDVRGVILMMERRRGAAAAGRLNQFDASVHGWTKQPGSIVYRSASPPSKR